MQSLEIQLLETEHLTIKGTAKENAPFPLRIKYKGIVLNECNLAGTPKNYCYCFVASELLEAKNFKTLANKVDKALQAAKG